MARTWPGHCQDLATVTWSAMQINNKSSEIRHETETLNKRPNATAAIAHTLITTRITRTTRIRHSAAAATVDTAINKALA